MESLPLFRPYFRTEECLDQIRECLERGWTGIGFKTVEFEKRWVEYTGLPHAHFLNSSTAGLHLAVKILKETYRWSAGDEIITTPLTFVSTNHAILYEGLTPVFADVDESLNLSPAAVESCITSRTRAVMFVGMGGSMDNLEEVAECARRHGISLILDAAHMSGSRLHGRHIGAEADVTVFSYQAVKNLPTGDSGMICCAEEGLDTVARRLSWLGINKDTYARTQDGHYKWCYDVDDVGFKYHGNSIMAAIGLVSLKYLDEDNGCRRALAARYQENLAAEPSITIVQHRSGLSSRHLFQILVEDREEVIAELSKDGISPGVHYRVNTDYRPYALMKNQCPRAQAFSQRLLSLPLHLHLGNDEIDYISEKLLSILRRKGHR